MNTMQKSITSKSAGSRIAGILFGLLFFGVGFLFCWMMAISPLLNVINSKDWIEADCVITSSKVHTNRSSDGDTYKIEISFSYELEGRNYRSDTYDFNISSSSGYDGKAKIVARYPVGSKKTCWINPEDPTHAVLSRKVPGIVYFVIPFTSIFMIIGLTALLGSFGLLPKSWSIPFNNARHKRVATEAKGTKQLTPKNSGIGKVLIITAVACFWNGIVSVFLFQVYKGFQEGDPEWFLAIFMIPFVCIGLLLILGIIHSLLSLANPKIELTLSESSPTLGQTVELEWQANKPLKRVSKLQILLIGKEAATYQRGTKTTTDTSTFHICAILDLENPALHQRGTVTLTIPKDSMHSFDSGNNKILWELAVDGTIHRFPDINDTYPITVRPLPSV